MTGTGPFRMKALGFDDSLISPLRVDPTHPQYQLGLGEEVEWFKEPVLIGHFTTEPAIPLLALGLSNAIRPAAFDALVVQIAGEAGSLMLWAKLLKFGQPFPFTTNETGLTELQRRYRLQQG
ncbi:hypothetical protein J0X19_20880 [Hymenobacter sp. BT186]|uniref:Uncharacterized protein n=1 Tax=Hymenobacter telluris TaxID=2816474 RepID=A0A939JB12_9BACT|nr:hypothetical protein [Hymenobacter telluris]MBO0360429.1 hypothetical protein [Hymenobacter telluris]MBW3376456.1 hypothetical protein [Hymenobacter norwichensis]